MHRSSDPYRFVAPPGELDEEWVARLQARMAERDDVAAVWWVTRIHEWEDPKLAVDEIHYELVSPPEGESATVEMYKDLSLSLSVPGGGPQWSIIPARNLERVRAAGARIA